MNTSTNFELVNNNINLTNQLNLHFVLATGLCSIIYVIWFSRFFNPTLPQMFFMGEDPFGTITLTFSQSLEILNNAGLNNLGSFSTLIGLIPVYFQFITNLSEAININWHLFDPSLLQTIHHNLCALIYLHEISFGIINYLDRISESLDFEILFDLRDILEQWRSLGNNLIAILRRIEGVLDIPSPIEDQWYED